MKGLTEKQQEILDFISEFSHREGMAPTVSEISEKLSFADIYTFSRFFKSATNLSPSEYRKKLRD